MIGLTQNRVSLGLLSRGKHTLFAAMTLEAGICPGSAGVDTQDLGYLHTLLACPGPDLKRPASPGELSRLAYHRYHRR
jgi:hypothetical protein